MSQSSHHNETLDNLLERKRRVTVVADNAIMAQQTRIIKGPLSAMRSQPGGSTAVG